MTVGDVSTLIASSAAAIATAAGGIVLILNRLQALIDRNKPLIVSAIEALDSHGCNIKKLVTLIERVNPKPAAPVPPTPAPTPVTPEWKGLNK